MGRQLWILCVAAALAGCASDDKLDRPVFEAPETAVTYEVAINGLPNEEMTALAEDALTVYRRQEDGAQSLAFLRRRAEGDVDVIQRILRSRGYYRGDVAVQVARLPRDEDADPEAPEMAAVTIDVTPGPEFMLTRHDFLLDDPSGQASLPPAGDLGSPVGQAAAAEPIVAAEAAALTALQRQGYAYAANGKRRAIADLDAATLEIESPLATGPLAVYGAITYEGLEDVRERYLRTYIPWQEGEVVDLAALRSYQQSLLGTDLFSTVRVALPETAPPGGGPAVLPIRVVAVERPFRTVSAGARFSTDDGPSVRGGFEHRNLYGENETVTLAAEAGIEQQSLGVGYREPQYMRPGQDLLGTFTLSREEDDAFDDLTATATIGLQRKLSPTWIVGAGLLGEASLITDQGQEQTAFLGGIPLFASYDGSDDPLNPTEGVRARLDLVPYAGVFDDEGAYFLSIDAQGSAYYDITGEQDYILAGRARLGSILAGDLSDVPQTRRLYSGGGGSVRGFAQRFVGPLDAQNDPTGGLSALELGTELRARLFGDFGGVLFVDAGAVSEQSFPDFNEGMQVAAGLGFRYYSPAGPIRVDVALPLNPRDADDAFQIYFSIGQAF
ncbi:MAG: BamA/TamA family outer membrane protein [Pseudomonadota bacterium]